jgi:hypothetical protein
MVASAVAAVQEMTQELVTLVTVDKAGFALFGPAPANSPANLGNKFKWKKNETAITN